jgi:AcrR family transcriptional regulator
VNDVNMTGDVSAVNMESVKDVGIRQTYHHGNLRAALVSTATELARANGPASVTVRETARRIGVSPSAAYRHFEDQAALLSAVSDVALLELAGRMRAAVAAAPAGDSTAGLALERFRAVGLAYVEFALSHPGLFRTAYAAGIDPGRSVDEASGRPLADHPLRILTEALDALVAADVLAPAQRQNAEIAAWAGVHGLSLLILDRALGPAAQDPQPLIDSTLDVIGLGLCAPALLTTGRSIAPAGSPEAPARRASAP